MNRAQRPYGKSQDDRRKWAAGQTRGVLDVRFLYAADHMPLKLAAAQGSEEARALLGAVENTLHHIKDAPLGDSVLCGGCEAAIAGTPFVTVVGGPSGRPLANATMFCVNCLCVECQNDILASSLTAYRRLWPDTRIIVVHPAGGTVQ